MSRVFVLKLPFDYTMYLSSMELYILSAVLLLIILFLTIKSFFLKVQGGREGVAGQKTKALGDFSKNGEVYEGQVFCMGEIWNAKADYPIMKGDSSIVSYSEALVLYIYKRNTEQIQEKECSG
ncbi:MAG: hypothetical protein FWH52_05065 [Synergistaceae bacterium]|nr:hypothetical protein [Synergistaceae bacterium]